MASILDPKAYAKVIQAYRKKAGYSMETLAQKIHCHKNSICNWERGSSQPDLNTIVTLCRVLQIPLNVFFGAASSEEDAGLRQLAGYYHTLSSKNRQIVCDVAQALASKERIIDFDSLRRKYLPIYQIESEGVSAGPGEWLLNEHEESTLRYVHRTPSNQAADMILAVNGDSMMPTIPDGSLVYIQKCSEIRPGEVGAFILDGVGYIKELGKDGLYSHNPQYSPILFQEGMDVRCAGRFLGILSPDDIETDPETLETLTEAFA